MLNKFLKQLLNESIEDHLKERGVDLSKTKVVLDTENNYASFFLYNLSGQLVGYQFYNPNGSKKLNQNKFDKALMKYYTFASDSKMVVYGLESYNLKSPYLFLTEGVFDTIKIHNAGYPSIAVLSAKPKKDVKTWLNTLPQIKIAILDNDENLSGDKLKSFSDYHFKTPDPYKDLGDMNQKDVNKFIEECIKNL